MMCDDDTIDDRDKLSEERVREIASDGECSAHIPQVLAIELLDARREASRLQHEVDWRETFITSLTAQKKATAAHALRLKKALHEAGQVQEGSHTVADLHVIAEVEKLLQYLEEAWDSPSKGGTGGVDPHLTNIERVALRGG